MTFEEQKARILSGRMYNDLTPELVEARRRAVEVTEEYNASYGKASEVREAILRRLVRHAGEGAFFEPDFHCEFGFNITLGKNFYANFGCILLDPGEIIIGDHVLFGPRVSIYTSRHAYDARERAAGACFAKPVKIGNNVWVGGGVHMDHGITIGDNTIIGAGSVITRDIPANVVAAGAPCRVIREIREDEKTDYLDSLEKEYSL
ncbi:MULTISPECIES: sugar O-acetyltransferase [Lachnospiraceae]|jgi:maltose O-acetyltransferase|uniref:Acetyltransferase n=1 Tax=Faecalicatena acetigenes TaxID=2981790 RepID=A0ABT2TDV2_9FIRM|nr:MULTISPECIES: sugar O-acetyltransferase [Lachnospiraceae]MCU6747987.1 sugar O-acetyltransferase [Faecalicatena acetigenes]RGT72396.1 sugar O-acetyltransferase [Ruminococcus sp. AF18-22]SCI20986.1 Galactoside O-acetyltransferase [uncultured Clostridium sp.]